MSPLSVGCVEVEVYLLADIPFRAEEGGENALQLGGWESLDLDLGLEQIEEFE